ncbi:uncharacterized protein TA18495 [Theileria annulata]|uniref:Midasin n=1 Tax=Theileria annulata TaxID=5874 RepID=Q4UBI9_THEAN|nr:uncharacterized protein TA18495 [Theileria annulata]CAI75812.1 hypothetical protein, conserved [Theileria annulata]|eukprot:XP_955288.1 hypothetical protein, conserved [Theileria annulata]
MDHVFILSDYCKIISNSLIKDLPNGSFTLKDIDFSNCNELFEQKSHKRTARVESRPVSTLFSNNFYDENEFAVIFVKFTEFLSKNDLPTNCKIDLYLSVISSCILNYKKTQLVFDTCPDIALSITLDLIESIWEDEFILEKLLLAYRLRNDLIIGRKCSRILSECRNNLRLHSLVNDLIRITVKNSSFHRIFILSQLSNWLNLNELSNLILYSKLNTSEGRDAIREILNGEQLIEFEKLINPEFQEIFKLSEHVLNSKPEKIEPITFSLKKVKINNFTPNLIQTTNHISFLRNNRKIEDKIFEDSNKENHLWDKIDKEEDEILSNLLFGIDCSIGVVLVGSCKNYNIRSLSKRLGMTDNEVMSVYTDESTEIKALIGSWITGENLGEFVYSYGIVSRAVREGKWLIFDSYLSNSVLSFLVNLCNSKSLYINELNETIVMHENFQIFILNTPVLSSELKLSNLPIIYTKKLVKDDMIGICSIIYPNQNIALVLKLIFDVGEMYEIQINLSKLLKFSKRIYPYLAYSTNQFDSCKNACVDLSSDNMKKLVLFDFFNIFVSDVGCNELRYEITYAFSKLLNLQIGELNEVFQSFRLLKRFVSNNSIYPIKDNQLDERIYDEIVKNEEYNNEILKMIYSSYVRNEPVLLVGETGTGKTALIQKFAQITGNVLKVFVFSENSDSNDLLGNFMPKNINPEEGGQEKVKYVFNDGILLECIKNGYWLLLDEINLSQYDLLYKLYSLLSSVYSNQKLGSQDDQENKIYLDLYEYINQRVEVNRNFRLFACMNPPIIKKNKIIKVNSGKKNLPPNLMKLFTTIYVDPIKKYDDLLRVANCYTGHLKINLGELCKFYIRVSEMVEQCEIEDGAHNLPNFTLRNFVRSVLYIVNKLTREFKPVNNLNKLIFDSIYANFLSTLEQNSINKLIDILPSGLSRYYQSQTNGSCDNNSSKEVDSIIMGNEKEYINICNYWIKLGGYKETNTLNVKTLKEHENSEENFVICSNNVNYLVKLVRIISGLKVPILLEGPTAAGKTSIVTYLCKLTRNKCVRINNYDNIDITDYIGQYHFINGKLVFQYGLLVIAMKYGYWVILDELNLASSTVLECLNRILDDNKEIYISETNEVIKCHENFMLFATQNPCDSIYGGRKQLSSSFKNRFIQIYFDEIRNEDLKLILYKRCDLPITKSDLIVRIYNNIKSTTLNSIFFNKNQILITIRDLIKLANRLTNYTNNEVVGKKLLYNEALIVFYYVLICEKLYNQNEKSLLFSTIIGSINSQNLNHKVDNSLESKNNRINDKKKRLYDIDEVEKSYVELLRASKHFKVEELRQFFVDNNYYWIDGYTDRIVYLVTEALLNGEHVLLVGETGIGKTTIVQLLSKFFNTKLNIFNCNFNTDTVDFIGSFLPTDRTEGLPNFIWKNGKLIESMINGEWFLFDEINLVQDSILEKINSILEFNSYIILNSGTATCNSVESCSQFNGVNDMEYVYSNKNFRVIGTMNPGNDFGKKELSPSISNRFTVIYLPTIDITNSDILYNIILQHNRNLTPVIEDWLIRSIVQILNLVSNRLHKVTIGVTSDRLTIRNIIIWTKYYYNTLSRQIDVDINDKITIFIDGLYISILNSMKIDLNIVEIENIILNSLEINTNEVHCKSDPTFGLMKNVNKGLVYYMERCIENIPDINILLEGNPGIGKTYNFYKVAKKYNKKLISVNLNEFTDIIDLLGSFVPGDRNDNEEISFVWKNGPLLECVINGYWALLDELNLASSEIIEGINSILDYRREIYIPEINKTIPCHKDFRLFATQNSITSNYRKQLPQSLLNRFIVFKVQDLTHDDYRSILVKKYPTLDHLIPKYIELIATINNEITHSGSEDYSDKVGLLHNVLLYNIRDLINILNLIQHYNEAVSIDININYKLNTNILRRLKSRLELSSAFPKKSFCEGVPPIEIIDYLDVYNNLILLYKFKTPVLFLYKGTNNIVQIIKNYNRLIDVNLEENGDLKEKVHLLNLYENNDVNDIIGTYEQINNLYAHNNIVQLYNNLLSKIKNRDFYIQFVLRNGYQDYILDSDEFLTHIIELCDHIRGLELGDEVNQILGDMDENIKLYDRKTVTYKWIDSDLIKCMENGHWLIINNIHLINSSLLDRLNSLLDNYYSQSDNSELGNFETFNINECGYNRQVKVNENFRIYFIIDSDYLYKISNSFLNRCVHLNIKNYEFLHNEKSILMENILKGLYGTVSIEIYVYEVYSIVNRIKKIRDVDVMITITILYLILSKLYELNDLFLSYFIRFYTNTDDLTQIFHQIIEKYYPNLCDVDLLSVGDAIINYLLNIDNKYYKLLREYLRILVTSSHDFYSLDIHLIHLYNSVVCGGIETDIIIPTFDRINEVDLSCSENFEVFTNLTGNVQVAKMVSEGIETYSIIWYINKYYGCSNITLLILILSNNEVLKNNLNLIDNNDFINTLYYISFLNLECARDNSHLLVNSLNDSFLDVSYITYNELLKYNIKCNENEIYSVINENKQPHLDLLSLSLSSVELETMSTNVDESSIYYHNLLYIIYIIYRNYFLDLKDYNYHKILKYVGKIEIENDIIKSIIEEIRVYLRAGKIVNLYNLLFYAFHFPNTINTEKNHGILYYLNLLLHNMEQEPDKSPSKSLLCHYFGYINETEDANIEEMTYNVEYESEKVYKTLIFMYILFSVDSSQFKSDIKCLLSQKYKVIFGCCQGRDEYESVNYELFGEQNCKENEVLNCLNKMNKENSSDVLYRVLKILVEHNLKIIPNISLYIQEMENHYQRQFEIYKKNEFKQISNTFNILDSLSLGYAKKVPEVISSTLDSEGKMESELHCKKNESSIIKLIYSFITEYNQFITNLNSRTIGANINSTNEVSTTTNLLLDSIKNFINYTVNKYKIIQDVIIYPILSLNSLKLYYSNYSSVLAQNGKISMGKFYRFGINVNINDLLGSNEMLKLLLNNSKMLEYYLFILYYNYKLKYCGNQINGVHILNISKAAIMNQPSEGCIFNEKMVQIILENQLTDEYYVISCLLFLLNLNVNPNNKFNNVIIHSYSHIHNSIENAKEDSSSKKTESIGRICVSFNILFSDIMKIIGSEEKVCSSILSYLLNNSCLNVFLIDGVLTIFRCLDKNLGHCIDFVNLFFSKIKQAIYQKVIQSMQKGKNSVNSCKKRINGVKTVEKFNTFNKGDDSDNLENLIEICQNAINSELSEKNLSHIYKSQVLPNDKKQYISTELKLLQDSGLHLNGLNVDKEISDESEVECIIGMLIATYSNVLENFSKMNTNEHKRVISLTLNALQDCYNFKNINNQIDVNYVINHVTTSMTTNKVFDSLATLYNISYITSQPELNFNNELFYNVIETNFKLLNIVLRLFELVASDPTDNSVGNSDFHYDLVLCTRQYNIMSKNSKTDMNNGVDKSKKMVEDLEDTNELMKSMAKLQKLSINKEPESKSGVLTNGKIKSRVDLDVKVLNYLVKLMYLYLIIPDEEQLDEDQREVKEGDIEQGGVGLDNEVGIKNISNDVEEKELQLNQEEIGENEELDVEDFEDENNIDIDDDINKDLEDLVEDIDMDTEDIEQMEGDPKLEDKDIQSVNDSDEVKEVDLDETNNLEDDLEESIDNVEKEIEEHLNPIDQEQDEKEDEFDEAEQMGEEEQQLEEEELVENTDVDEYKAFDEKEEKGGNVTGLKEDPSEGSKDETLNEKDVNEGVGGLTNELDESADVDVDVNTLKQNNDNTLGSTDNDKLQLDEKERNNLEPGESGKSLNEAKGKSSENREENDSLNPFKLCPTDEIEETLQTNDCEMIINNLLYQLNIILEYNKCSGFKGYYKYGKKISIKRLMGFIATNYQNSKIWLKRLKKTQRNYYIQLAIDNTKSMKSISNITLQTIYIIYQVFKPNPHIVLGLIQVKHYKVKYYQIWSVSLLSQYNYK